MKRLPSYVLCLLVAVLPACAALTPQQQSAGRQSIQAAYERGEITQAQRDASIEILDTAGETTDWSALLTLGGSVLASVLLGVPISVGAVQRKRGPVATPEERVRRMAGGSKSR
jgi:hypothetical protein